MINISDLKKSFGATRAVDGISLSLNTGEVLGFLGPNGAGKTTTLRIIACYLAADSGSVTVDGFDTAENSLDVRRCIGYLPENNPLYSEMDVTDYLDYIARIRKIPKYTRATRVRETVERCALGDVRYKGIAHLSKGYRQRVGIAQTLLHDPKYLILDEPTSGLDPTQIIEIRNLIKEIGSEKAVILSTHILPEVEATCGRVIIINKGKISFESNVDELSAKSAGESVLYVAVKGPAEEVSQKLGALEGATGVKTDREIAENHNRYIVTSPHGTDLSEAAFNLAVQRKWTLTELKIEEATLENVFLSITGSTQ